MKAHLTIDQEKIAEFCRRHHIRRLALFGSVLREDFTPESDVDVLVEFDPEHIPGLAFFGMEEELSEMLGRKVDLLTPECLSKYFRERYSRRRRSNMSRHDPIRLKSKGKRQESKGTAGKPQIAQMERPVQRSHQTRSCLSDLGCGQGDPRMDA